MEILLYAYIYIIGVLLGSFFTLAVHRIPRKENITHVRSYCPKCNHRLNFFDLIPVLSYIFLRGKCRYCHEKIRPRYIILELSSGVIFLLFAMCLNIDIFNIEINKIATLIFGIFFISVVILTIGIFKEYKVVEKSVLNIGIISEIIYMIYLYTFNNINIYRYIICLGILIIQFLLNLKTKKDVLRRTMFIVFSIIGLTNIIATLI